MRRAVFVVTRDRPCEFVETKDWPTIWEDHFYPEIVDPASGTPVPDGQPGELVFTALTKEALQKVLQQYIDAFAAFIEKQNR